MPDLPGLGKCRRRRAPATTVHPAAAAQANVGMLAGGAGQVQFAIKIGGQVLPVALTAGPGQLVPLDEPLDAFIGANTIEITVTGSPLGTAGSRIAAPSVR